MSMDDRDGVIWLDGEMVPWREAKVHVLTHTLHYGMGVFEGVRAYKAEQGTAIFSFVGTYRSFVSFGPYYEYANAIRCRYAERGATCLGARKQSGKCLHPPDVLLWF